jgi:hypothetical protein
VSVVKFDWVSGDVDRDAQDTLRPGNEETSGAFCSERIPTCREKAIPPGTLWMKIAGSKFKAVDDITKSVYRKGGPEHV